MSTIGDNGGPPIIDVNPDDLRLAWIRLDIKDFMRGVRDMDMETRGYYITILCDMYDAKGGSIPFDLPLLGKRYGTTARVIRRVVDLLLEEGKIYVAGDRLRNQRCDEERERLIAEYCRRHLAAIKREAAKREADATAEVSAKFGESFEKVSPKQSSNSPELRQNFGETIGILSTETTKQAPELCHSSDHSSGQNLRTKKKEEEKKKDIRAVGTAPVEEIFEQFWSAFPTERRRGKGRCRDLFALIVSGRHKTRRATADEIVAAVRAGTGIDPNFPPMPETWLNQGRWEDGAGAGGDPAPVNSMPWGWWRGKEERLQRLSLDRWRDAVKTTKPNGTWPWWVLGAPPGHAECLMPETIVLENNYLEIYRGQIHHD